MQGALRWDDAKRWPAQAVGEVADYALQDGDVVVAMDRPWIEAGLKHARVRSEDLPALLVQRVARLRGKERLHTPFLKYAIGSQAFTHHILSVQTGTTVPHISATQIKQFLFPLPPLSEQKSIADTLGALDDKIKVNRQMSATLEAMARALFESWFVDFNPVHANAEGRDAGLSSAAVAERFPASLQTSELGDIPAGWSVMKLNEVADYPRRTIAAHQIDARTPYIGLEHMPRRSIALTEWATAEGLESGKTRFERGEILFGKLRTYFHKVGVAPVDGVCSTDIVVVAPRSKSWFGFVLGHVSSDAFVAYADGRSTGTRMPRTSWHEMARYPIPLPPLALADAFTATIQPMTDRILASIHESRTLASLRNALLPKLISGELRVPDAERIAVEAGA